MSQSYAYSAQNLQCVAQALSVGFGVETKLRATLVIKLVPLCSSIL